MAGFGLSGSETQTDQHDFPSWALKLMSDQLGIKFCPASRQKVTAGQQLNKTKCAICTSGCTHLPILTVHHQCGAHWQSTEPRVIDSRNLSESPGLPSGKRLHNYGKSPPLMGKSTINCHFQYSSFLYVYKAGYMKSKRLSPLFGNGSTASWLHHGAATVPPGTRTRLMGSLVDRLDIPIAACNFAWIWKVGHDSATFIFVDILVTSRKLTNKYHKMGLDYMEASENGGVPHVTMAFKLLQWAFLMTWLI